MAIRKDVEWYIEGPKKIGPNAIMIDIIDGETDSASRKAEVADEQIYPAKKQY